MKNPNLIKVECHEHPEPPFAFQLLAGAAVTLALVTGFWFLVVSV